MLVSHSSCSSRQDLVRERHVSELTYDRITPFSTLPAGILLSLLHSLTPIFRSSDPGSMASMRRFKSAMSSASCCSSSSSSLDPLDPASPIGCGMDGRTEALLPLDRWSVCSSRWMAASCWRRKNSFCCLDKLSSTAVAIFLDSSNMDACLTKISVASFSRASVSGVPRMAEKNTLMFSFQKYM